MGQRDGSTELKRDECLRLLATQPVGRVIYTENAIPAARLVCFVVDGDDVVLNASDGEQLRRALHRSVVAFEVDQVNAVTRSAWSVVVAGHANLITDADRLAMLRQAGLTSWVSPHPTAAAAVRVESVTGRAVGRTAGWGAWRNIDSDRELAAGP